ncbi:hypothetical protein BASA62_006211 [Batrachochytrium salamandrivorans]|nr:hypothetical protein BASA62_006211 [Batrachochytrium salamandrivorans]
MPMSAPPMSHVGPSQPLHQQYYPSYSPSRTPPQTFTALEALPPVGYYQQAPYPHPPSHMPVYYAPQYDQPYDQQSQPSQYDQRVGLALSAAVFTQGYLPHPDLALRHYPPPATTSSNSNSSSNSIYAAVNMHKTIHSAYMYLHLPTRTDINVSMYGPRRLICCKWIVLSNKSTAYTTVMFAVSNVSF